MRHPFLVCLHARKSFFFGEFDSIEDHLGNTEVIAEDDAIVGEHKLVVCAGGVGDNLVGLDKENFI